MSLLLYNQKVEWIPIICYGDLKQYWYHAQQGKKSFAYNLFVSAHEDEEHFSETQWGNVDDLIIPGGFTSKVLSLDAFVGGNTWFVGSQWSELG